MRMAALHYGLGLPRAGDVAVTGVARLPGRRHDED